MGRWLDLPTRPKASLVGIDISAQRIKLLELARHERDGYRVQAYASVGLPAGAVEDFAIEDAEVVARAIATAIERSGTRTREAAIAVAGPAVISKTVLLPAAMDDIEMEQQIHLDAEQYVSHAISDVHIDFQVLEPDPRDANFNRVLLVACRRETIEMRLAALEMAGMTVRLVDVEEYALQNACALLAERATPDEAPAQNAVAVFDVGSQDTRLTVQHGARSRYNRSIAFGGQMVARRLVARHGLTGVEQLHSHLRTGEIGPADIAADVETFAAELAGHIERTLNFYLSASAQAGETIDCVIITGGVARYPGLADALAGRLPWTVRLGNPLARMPASPAARRNHVEDEASALMVAAGLALRGAA